MDQPVGQRRLAAIVAVDVAGYSRRSETDEAGAVGAVQSLARETQEAAADHGGRVFNTAGDGFMLEFPAVSSALDAAMALIGRTSAPVRVGVHLGEVHATASGDLLGHGVNVAARLQAMAKPGSILVSDAARQAARGPQAAALVDQGRVRLDKMSEATRVFAVKGLGPARGKSMHRTRTRLIWAAGGAAAALLALGLWAGAARMAAASPELKSAVRDFTLESSGLDPQLGVAMADGAAATTVARHAPTVSRDRVRRGDTEGARLLVGGEISRDGPNLRAHVHIDDAKAGLILWSGDFERPPDQADALQDAVATKVADLMDQLHRDAAVQGARLSGESLAALVQAEDVSRLSFGQSDDPKREAWRRVVALAPDFSLGHSKLAFFDLAGKLTSPEQRAARLEEARAQVALAFALNPRDGEAFLASSYLPAKGGLAEQEAWLLRGIAVDPGRARLNYDEANILAAAGRMIQALPVAQLALDEDPLSRMDVAQVVFALMGVGRMAEARELNARARRLWPDYAAARNAEMYLGLIYGDAASGKAVLAAAERGELPLTAAHIAAWRKYLAARAGKLPPAVAGRALVDAARQDGQLDLGLEITALSQLGEVDMAYAELDRRFAARAQFYESTLFQPAAANLRKDARFMPLVARTGLTRYWLGTGRWPDYCAEPDLPYACPAAAKAAMLAGNGPRVLN